MKELYFLTILDGMNSFLGVLTGAGLTLGTMALFAYIMFNVIEKTHIPALKNWAIILIVTGSCSGLINVFVPTTKQATMIYGVGTVVDYIQTNEDVKQLPDKCVQALNMWVDNCLEEQQSHQNK